MFIRRLVSSRTVSLIRNCIETRGCTSQTIGAQQYPVKGDDGKSIVAGTVLPKCDYIFEALGSTEELQCYLGLAREFALESDHDYGDKLKRIQTVLVDIGQLISQSNDSNVLSISKQYTKELEEWINDYNSKLPPVEHFIIPGGGSASAALHVARAVCRRTERQIVNLVLKGIVDKEAQIYLNRLSDFLLTISRIAVKEDKRNETIYIPSHTASENKQNNKPASNKDTEEVENVEKK